jgi:hypothetical protein
MNGKITASSAAAALTYLSVSGIDHRRLKRQRKSNCSIRRQDELDESSDVEDDRVKKAIRLYKDQPLPPDVAAVRQEMDRKADLEINLDFFEQDIPAS